MKRFLITLAALGLLGFWWYKRQNDTGAAAVDAAGLQFSDTNLNTPGLSVGQLGSTFITPDTSGDALASALAALFSDGSGSFKYVGPDFTLESQKYDLGGRALLRPIYSSQDWNNVRAKIANGGKTQMIQARDLENSTGAYIGWFEVVSQPATPWSVNDPRTYLIL